MIDSEAAKAVCHSRCTADVRLRSHSTFHVVSSASQIGIVLKPQHTAPAPAKERDGRALEREQSKGGREGGREGMGG